MRRPVQRRQRLALSRLVWLKLHEDDLVFDSSSQDGFTTGCMQWAGKHRVAREVCP